MIDCHVAIENNRAQDRKGGSQAAPPPTVPKPGVRPQGPRKAGSTVDHPKYGRGTIIRREGEGEDAKLTVSFPKHGLKKLIEKYAGLKTD